MSNPYNGMQPGQLGPNMGGMPNFNQAFPQDNFNMYNQGQFPNNNFNQGPMSQGFPPAGGPNNFGGPQPPFMNQDMGGIQQGPQGLNPEFGVPQMSQQTPIGGMNPYGQPLDMGGMQQGPNNFGGPQPPFMNQNMGGIQQGPQSLNPEFGVPQMSQQTPMGGMNPYGQPLDMGGMQQGPNNFNQPNPEMNFGPMQQSTFNPSAASQMTGTTALQQTIIAVNCPKGGVGKTTISKELAIAYATTRVNGKPLKVCLVDGNIGFGDVTTMLKVPSRPNIKTWTTDIQERLKNNQNSIPRYSQETIEREYLIKHQSGLYILAAPSNHADSLDIDSDQMNIVIENLKNCDFDIIIIDTANNTQDYTLVALEKAQKILMVTTMEVTSISDTRSLLTTLREIQFPVDRIQLVINKMPQKQDKDIDLNEIALVLQCPIIGVIPDFPSIRKINNNGEPAMLGKENELTTAIRDLANKVVPVFGSSAPMGNKTSGQTKEKKGLFGGMFKKKK